MTQLLLSFPLLFPHSIINHMEHIRRVWTQSHKTLWHWPFETLSCSSKQQQFSKSKLHQKATKSSSKIYKNYPIDSSWQCMIKTIEKLKPKPLLVITTKNTTLTSSEKQEKFKKKKKVLPKLQALILNSKLRFETESPRSFFTSANFKLKKQVSN